MVYSKISKIKDHIPSAIASLTHSGPVLPFLICYMISSKHCIMEATSLRQVTPPMVCSGVTDYRIRLYKVNKQMLFHMATFAANKQTKTPTLGWIMAGFNSKGQN